jgi:hypothetical protein
MKTYSYSEAYKNFPMILDTALTEDVVIKRKDVSAFKMVYTNDRKNLSPFDVPGINSQLTTQEIVNFVREGRETVRSAAL